MKERLDVLLVGRGLAQSREKAKAIIMSGNVFVVEDGLPCAVAVAVFTAEEGFVREAGVVLFVELFLIIIADDVERVDIADIGGEFGERDGGGDGAGGIAPLDDGDEFPCDNGEAFHIGASAVVFAFGFGFVGVVVAKNLIEKRSYIGVIGIIDFVAD